MLFSAFASSYALAVAQTNQRAPHTKAPPSISVHPIFGHQEWSTENGLPQNSVHQLLQTRDGYLWIATEGGVARFNGMQFTVFSQETEPAFLSNDACCLAEDSSGALWIGTSDGLLRFAAGKFRRYGVAEGLPSSTILTIIPSGDGGVVVLTDAGLASSNADRFTALRETTSAIGQGSDGSVLLAGPAGVSDYRMGAVHPVSLPSVPAGTLEGLGMLPDGTPWVRTRTTLTIWQGSRIHAWSSERDFPGTRVESVLGDLHGLLWVGTDQGLVTLNRETGEILRQPALQDDSILSLLEDHESNLWVGTDTAGLHILRQPKFHAEPGVPGRPIAAVTQTSDGTMWSGSDGDGLFAISSRGQPRHLTTKDGLLSDVILALAPDRDGSLWIGTPDGLNHLRGSNIEAFTSADGLPDDFIRSLFSDNDGTVWVGTRRGLAHRVNGRFSTLSKREGFPSELIGSILRSSTNDLWIGTLAGLVRIRDGVLTTFTTRQGLSGDVVTSLLEDAHRTLWVGTKDGGLSLWSGDHFVPVTAHDLPKAIDGIVVDNRGYLWLSFSRGIARASAAALNGCNPALPCNAHVAIYGTSDGMPSEEASSSGHPSSWLARDGTLWFATRKGVAVIDPGHLAENSIPPPVVIEHFRVDDQEWKSDGTEALVPPGHTRFAFDYAGLSYVAPARVHYRSILEGFDQHWTNADLRRSATYTNLPPRHYRFRVQAANEDGMWNETGATFAFYVQPPFYRTAWFLALATLLLCGGIWAGYQTRVRLLRSQFDAVLAERNRIAREIHDTLAQGFVGVSVQLELAAHLLANAQVTAASEQVDRTRTLVREGLADARRSIWELRAATTEAALPMRLTHLVEQIASSRLATKVEIGGTYRALAPELEREILRIAQEALANIVRHSGATRVVVDLRYHPSELLLRIEDDGHGFESGDTTLPARGHFGLQGMRERAAEIGGELEVESSPQRGTTVRLKAPLPQERQG